MSQYSEHGISSGGLRIRNNRSTGERLPLPFFELLFGDGA